MPMTSMEGRKADTPIYLCLVMAGLPRAACHDEGHAALGNDDDSLLCRHSCSTEALRRCGNERTAQIRRTRANQGIRLAQASQLSFRA